MSGYQRVHAVPLPQFRVLNDITAERERQTAKWGEQDHEPPIWLAILMEEVGELARTMFEPYPSYVRREHMRTEAIHVAAVAVQFIEWMDRQEAR